jgi:hypothetical protein
MNCTLCNVSMSGSIDYKLHMESKNHKRKAKIQIKKEINTSGSFRKYLMNKEFITNRKSNLNRIRFYLYVNSMRAILK